MSKAIICNKYHYCLHLCQGYGQVDPHVEEQIDKFVQIKLSLDFYDLNCEGKTLHYQCVIFVCSRCARQLKDWQPGFLQTGSVLHASWVVAVSVATG